MSHLDVALWDRIKKKVMDDDVGGKTGQWSAIKAMIASKKYKEAEITLMKDEDPSVRLYDLIDSKLAGTQDGSIRSNDETGLYLAKGGNAVLVKKAQARNAIMDNETDPKSIGRVGRPPKIKEDKMRKLTDFPGFQGLK